MVAWFIVVLAVILLSIAYVVYNYINIKKLGEGTPEMAELAGIIRSGARVFIRTEFRTVAIVVVIVALVFSLFVEKTSGITFIIGALMSSVVCILGMRSATYANVRTANKAMESRSIGETVKVALCGGSISGLSVQAFGMLGFVLIMLVQGAIDTNAVGGGLLTTIEGMQPLRACAFPRTPSAAPWLPCLTASRAATTPRRPTSPPTFWPSCATTCPRTTAACPNVIADFIGDNVNDIAGNCSDLLESFVATLSAGVMHVHLPFQLLQRRRNHLHGFREALQGQLHLPGRCSRVCGLLGCLLGLGYAAYRKMGDNPSKELNLATWISAGITVVLGFFAALILFTGKDMSLYRRVQAGAGSLRGFPPCWASSSGVADRHHHRVLHFHRL